MVATTQSFALSSTNIAMSAYGRFKYERSFFSKYRVDVRPEEDATASVSGQIATKVRSLDDKIMLLRAI